MYNVQLDFTNSIHYFLASCFMLGQCEITSGLSKQKSFLGLSCQNSLKMQLQNFPTPPPLLPPASLPWLWQRWKCFQYLRRCVADTLLKCKQQTYAKMSLLPKLTCKLPTVFDNHLKCLNFFSNRCYLNFFGQISKLSLV